MISAPIPSLFDRIIPGVDVEVVVVGSEKEKTDWIAFVVDDESDISVIQHGSLQPQSSSLISLINRVPFQTREIFSLHLLELLEKMIFLFIDVPSGPWNAGVGNQQLLYFC